MGLEVATYIHELVATNPLGGSDPKSQGDDHFHLIKSTLQNTFPNIEGEITLTHLQINQAAVKTDQNNFSATQRVIGTINPTTGSGLELQFAAGVGTIVSYNRDASAYLPLQLYGSTVTVGLTGSTSQVNLVATDEINLTATNEVFVDTFNLKTLVAGTYTPSAFNGINCGVTPNKHFYSRVGNIVTVSGSTAINITSGGGTSTSFELSLPIASDFTLTVDAAGQGSNDDTGAETIRINANTANNRAGIFFNAVSTGLGTLFYTFQYEVK